MEILINELSLNGQFESAEQFATKALPHFCSVLKEINSDKDFLYKKYNMYECFVVTGISFHDILIGKEYRKFDEIRMSKSLLFKHSMQNPYWEDNQRHNAEDIYEFSGMNIVGTSIAEACERDRVIISFIHDDYSTTKLFISKNTNQIDVDNLFLKEHYLEVAKSCGQMVDCEYFERKFALGLITLLENECRFTKTNRQSGQGTIIYKENRKEQYWYLDNFHHHYEVFNSIGIHIGEANLHGEIDYSKKDRNKTIKI